MSSAPDYLELVRNLISALNGRRNHPAHHPAFERSLARLEQSLHNLMVSRDEIQLGVLGDHLLADGLPWEEQEEPLSHLSRELRSHGIDKLTFQRGFTRTDLGSLLEVLAGDRATVRSVSSSAAAQDLLAGRGVSRIRVGRHETTGKTELAEEEITPEARAYRDTVDGLEEAMDCARGGRFLRTRQLLTLVEGLMQHLARDPAPLLMQTARRKPPEYAATHVVNVAILTMAQVQALSSDAEVIREYGAAALMHDLGKVRIPAEILEKRSRLSEAEVEVLRRHPVDSLHLLRETPGVGDLALVVAFEHHRRFDLSGYPVLPRPLPQHFASRLVALADAYDAMRSDRSYQREIPPEQALDILRQQSGKLFDPVLVRLFIRMVGAFPPGTRIRLDTGEEAVVVKANPSDPHRPIVRLEERVSDAEDRFRLVNLGERDPKTGAYRRSAICSLLDFAHRG
ncbi:MAG TPA: HD domain-containing phosphohydrolase [Candidatus Polarisedimenticolia bacterium]|nr:HD domain-containing phosphohydrolase [Candidatus Polarisedimenticolia bacterium]